MTTDELNAREIAKLIQRSARPRQQFNNVGPFSIDGDSVMEIESNFKDYPQQFGKLWTGATWLTVDEARELRDWLDDAIPRAEDLDPRRGEKPIAPNE